jgi:2-aminoethylphosphonate dioxygenase
MLSDDQRKSYQRDGFVVLRAHIPAPLVARIAAWADELLAAPAQPGHVRKYGDDDARARGERLLSRIEYFYPFHAGFRELLDSALLRQPAGDALGEPPVLFKDKLNYKLPGTAGFALHQDLQAGWHAYASELVTLMLSIDATTSDNGCLQLATAQHTQGLLGPEWEPMRAEALRAPLLEYPTEPGDVVLFSAYTPHASQPNRTAQPRRALFVTYNACAQGDHYERYFADKLRSYPPDVEQAPGVSYRYRV